MDVSISCFFGSSKLNQAINTEFRVGHSVKKVRNTKNWSNWKNCLKQLMKNSMRHIFKICRIDMEAQNIMLTKITQRELYYSFRRYKKDSSFLTDEISQRRRPCTPDIRIDLVLCSDPDIYFLANCKRQHHSVHKNKTHWGAMHFLLSFGLMPHPSFKRFSSFQVAWTQLSYLKAAIQSGDDTEDKCWEDKFSWLLAHISSIFIKLLYELVSRWIFFFCYNCSY